MKTTILSYSLVAALSVACSASAFAQQAVSLPGSVDAGRVEGLLGAGMAAPVKLGEEDLKSRAVAPVFEDSADGFVLKDLRYEGARAFSIDTLRMLMAPYIGRRVSERELDLLAEYLSNYYRQQGYFLSKVLVKDYNPDKGTAILYSIEGYAAEVRIEENGVDLNKDWQGVVRKTLSSITEMRPLHGPTLERKILLLSDLYGLDASMTLVPLSDVEMPPPGGVGVIVSLQEKPRRSSVEFNNFGSVFAGPGQNIYTLNTGTPLYAFDNLRLQFLHSFPISEARYAAVDYSMPLGANGLTAAIKAYKSWLRPTQRLRIFDLKSQSEGVGLSLSYPFIRSRAENLYGFAGFDVRNSQTDILGTKLFNDKVRALYLGGTYEFMDRTQGINSITATLTQGLGLLGASEKGDLNLSRQQGEPEFTKLNAQMMHSRYVGDSIRVTGGVSGQYSPDPLLSSEEFGYGGPSIGRAYDSSEIMGDTGVSGFIELSYTGLPKVEKINLSAEPYAFYDIGKVWNEDRGMKPESGASAGLGMRFNTLGNISGNAGFAVPLTREIADPITGSGYDPRFFLQIGTSF